MHFAGERNGQWAARFAQVRQHLIMTHLKNVHIAHAGDDISPADLGRGRPRLTLGVLHDRFPASPGHESHTEASRAAEHDLDELVRHGAGKLGLSRRVEGERENLVNP